MSAGEGSKPQAPQVAALTDWARRAGSARAEKRAQGARGSALKKERSLRRFVPKAVQPKQAQRKQGQLPLRQQLVADQRRAGTSGSSAGGEQMRRIQNGARVAPYGAR